jgi:hypothetical protein
MIVSNLILDVNAGGFKRGGSQPGLKIVNFFRKTDFSSIYIPPTNWGTGAIMLPPVVAFKKILQKSYANDIPK